MTLEETLRKIVREGVRTTPTPRHTAALLFAWTDRLAPGVPPRIMSEVTQFYTRTLSGIDPGVHDSGDVYLIAVVDRPIVKVGVSRDVGKRLEDLQSTNPDALQVLAILAGGRKLERLLLHALQPHRIRGEWFRFERELEILLELAAVGRQHWGNSWVLENQA